MPNPLVHLTFSDESKKLFATATSTSIADDDKWIARCETSGAHYHQGDQKDAEAWRERLRRQGYTLAVDPATLLGPEPLRRSPSRR